MCTCVFGEDDERKRKVSDDSIEDYSKMCKCIIEKLVSGKH